MRSRLTFPLRLLATVAAVFAARHLPTSASGTSPPSPLAAPALQPSRREPGRDFYEIAFRGGERAEVSISGSGATNLELLVYRLDGQLVCSSKRAGDHETCAWFPGETAKFIIEVRNLGGQANDYSLWTN